MDQQAISELQARDLPATSVAAQNDTEAVAIWLRTKARRSPSTFDRYSREARRFLEHLSRRGRVLRSVTLEDVHAYEKALLLGQVTGRAKSRAGVEGVFDVLGSMFGMLTAAGYLSRNVLVLRESLHIQGNTGIERFLSNPELDALVAAAGALVDDAEQGFNNERAARLRFLLAWFLSTGSRISETLKSPMNAVYMTQEAGQLQWNWRVVRKGGREDDIPLRDDALDALVRYRQHLGLPPYPSPRREEGFLVYSLRRTSRRPLWRGTISQELKGFFHEAAGRLEDAALRAHMMQATTHWLRHTGATQLLDAGASMRFVSKLLGHSSITVTSKIYDHADRATWRNEMDKGKQFRF
ncbi:MAG: tyrosine-type recombinase/integrase [Salinisphaera sp.]|nr:tyrosine-type recombinase/integrase [Salinisphaera sp.]